MHFEITVPISCYIAQPFVPVTKEFAGRARIKANHQEANSMTAIDRVADHDSNIGIIRYRKDHGTKNFH